MQTILNLVLESAPIQGAIYALLVFLLGLAVKRFQWVSHIKQQAIIAYFYAQDQGKLKGLKGAEKLAPFMDKLRDEYFQDFGKLPTPKAKAIAVEELEKKVSEEHLGK